MKRTCSGCRAFEIDRGSVSCQLGYRVQSVQRLGVTVDGKPLQQCPKPRTLTEFYVLMSDKRTPA